MHCMNSVLFKTLTSSQLVKKFPAFYRTREFIAAMPSLYKFIIMTLSSLSHCIAHIQKIYLCVWKGRSEKGEVYVLFIMMLVLFYNIE